MVRPGKKRVKKKTVRRKKRTPARLTKLGMWELHDRAIGFDSSTAG